MKLFGLLLLLCVGSWLLSSAHLTNAAALNCMMPVVSSTVTLNSLPVTYDDSSAAALGTCSSTGSTASCPGSGAPLGDGVLGSGALDNSQVFAWNSDVFIDYQFSGSSSNPPRLVNLYFYNEPTASSAVGLPIIRLMFDTLPDPVHYVFLGNQDVKESDSQYRSISLAFTTAISDLIFDTFSISMSFLNTNLNWVALSEIELCAEEVNVTNEVVAFVDSEPSEISLGPDPVVSVVDLFCTVVNQGLYSWQWSFEGAPFTPHTFSDATRTSTITISSLSAESAGLYKCQTSDDTTQNINVSLNRNLVAIQSSVSVPLGGSAELSCELYGYLRSGSSTAISWLFDSVPVNSSLVQEQPGTHMIQNGGVSPTLSVISVVTLQNLTSTMFGTYHCKYNESFGVITLEEIGSGRTTGPIIGGVIAAVGLAICIAVVLMIVLFIWLRKRNVHCDQFDTDLKDPTTSGPCYATVNKPQPSSNSNQFCMGGGGYSTIDTPDDVCGHIELTPIDKVQDIPRPLPPLPESTLQLVEIDQSPVFLQNNPESLHNIINLMYSSSDRLDQDESFMQSQTNRHTSTVVTLPQTLDIYTGPSHIKPHQVSPPLECAPIYSEAGLTLEAFRAGSPHASSPPLDQLHPQESIYANPSPLIKSEGPMELTHGNIKEERVLGTGLFGQVVLANTIGVSLKDLKLHDTNDDKSVTVLVAIKKLKHNPDQFIKEAFEKEIKFMSRLRDENVVRLLAICSSGDPFIVMEYMENCDLNQYLKNREFGSNKDQLPASILLYMCLQISSGMCYLASLNFIHRDLATRNCLVGADNVVKVADFGMSHSLYSSYYYRIKGRFILPIRWMAYECFYGKFSEKTDVWAFGVTMWEMFTFAKKQPYKGMSDQELINSAIRGPDRLLLSRPDTCPEEVFEVMLRCWVHEPEERADFEEIHSSLSAIFAYMQ